MIIMINISDETYNYIKTTAKRLGQTEQTFAANLLTHATKNIVEDSLDKIIGGIENIQNNGQNPEIETEIKIDNTKRKVNDSLENIIGVLDSNNSNWAKEHDKYIGLTISNKFLSKE